MVNVSEDPLTEVYEKFKHLDGPLSDTNGDKNSDDPGAFIHWMAGEMWRAIKEEVERRKKDAPPGAEAQR